MKKKIWISIALLLLACLCATFCACSNRESVALSCKDAAAKGFNIYLIVDKDVTSVDLSKKINASIGVSWKVYKDQDCTYELDTTVGINDGENLFYISTTMSGFPLAVYTLSIFRHCNVNITYFVGDEQYKVDTVPSDKMYFANAAYVPQVDGMEFEYWMDANGKKVINFMPNGDTSLFAKLNAYTYTATLSDGQTTIGEKQIEFGAPFELPVPTKEHYQFDGWSYNGKKITDGNGKSIANWNIATNATLLPTWAGNKHTVTASSNNTQYGGTIQGAGQYEYLQTVTLTATTNSTSIWRGWYENDTLISRELTYSFAMPDSNVNIQAKWARFNVVMSSSSAGSFTLSGDFIVDGKIRVYANVTNDGYSWVGWYNSDKLITAEEYYTLTAADEDITLTAKWTQYRVYLYANSGDVYLYGNAYNKNKAYYISAGDSFKASTTAPDDTYTFDGWYDGDELISSQSEYTFKMPNKNLSLTAKWVQYKVMTHYPNDIGDSSEYAGRIYENVYSANSVKVRYLTPRAVRAGLGVTIEVDPDKDVKLNKNPLYIWGGWYKDGELLTTNIKYSFVMPKSDITFTANWIKVLDVEINIPAAGEVSVWGNKLMGEELNLFAYSYEGYKFEGWYKDDELITPNLSCNLTVAEDDSHYIAKFAVLDAMKNFIFTSDHFDCVITGVIDRSVTEIVIPGYVTGIANEAFRGLTSLQTVTIERDVKEIGENAFADCTSLETVNFASAFYVKTIGYNAFANTAIGENGINYEDTSSHWKSHTKLDKNGIGLVGVYVVCTDGKVLLI